jgi:hypothetical protein
MSEYLTEADKRALTSKQFSLTDEMLYRQLKEAIIDFSMEDFSELVAADYFISAMIDGERRFHRLSAKTLMLVNVEYHSRLRANPYFNLSAYHKTQAALDAGIKRIKGKSVRFAIETSLEVIDESVLSSAERYHVHLPIARGNDVTLMDAQPVSYCVAAPEALQRTVYFNAPASERRFAICYVFCRRGQNVHRDVNAAKPLPQCKKDSLSTYLAEKNPHIIFTDAIGEIVDRLSGDETNPLVIARRLYDYVTQSIRYAFMPDYRLIPQLPTFALEHGKGDCGTQALLWVTMLRYAGIPATMTSGRMLSPIDNQTGMHDWVAFYIEPFGWIEADPSYGEEALRCGRTDKWHYYFENVDPFRMAANFDIQTPFEFKQIRREDPIDNQSGEIDTESGLEKPAYETNTTILLMAIEGNCITYEG